MARYQSCNNNEKINLPVTELAILLILGAEYPHNSCIFRLYIMCVEKQRYCVIQFLDSN